MKEEEFRKLLFEYMDELRNPEHRAETEAYLKQLEANGEVPSNMKIVRPKSGFAIEVPLRANALIPSPSTSSPSSSSSTNVSSPSSNTNTNRGAQYGEKIYINIVHDTAIDPPIFTTENSTKSKKGTSKGTGVQLPSAVGSGRHENDLDKASSTTTKIDNNKNNLILTFDVCFHTETIAQCLGKNERSLSFREAVCQAALELVDKRMKQVALPNSLLNEKDGLYFIERKYKVLDSIRCVGGQPAPLNLPNNEKPDSKINKTTLTKENDATKKPTTNKPTASSPTPAPSIPPSEPAKHGTVIKTLSSTNTSTATKPATPGIFIPKIEIVHRGNFDMLDHLMNPLTSTSNTPVMPSTSRPKELIIRITLPGVVKVSHVECDIEEQTVNIQTTEVEVDGKKGKYSYTHRLPYPILTDETEPAKWDKTKSLLTLTVKVQPPPKIDVPVVTAPSLIQEVEETENDKKHDTKDKNTVENTTGKESIPAPKVEESHSRWIKQREVPLSTTLPTVQPVPTPAPAPTPVQAPVITKPLPKEESTKSDSNEISTQSSSINNNNDESSVRAGGEPPFRWRQTADIITIIFDLPSVDKNSILIESNQKINGNAQNIRISMQSTVSPLQLYERKHGPLNLPTDETVSKNDKYVYAIELPLYSYVELPNSNNTSKTTNSRYDVSDENVVMVFQKAKMEGKTVVSKWPDLRRAIDEETSPSPAKAVTSTDKVDKVVEKKKEESTTATPTKVAHTETTSTVTSPSPVVVPSPPIVSPPPTPAAEKTKSTVKSTPKQREPEPEPPKEEEHIFELGSDGVFDITAKTKPKTPSVSKTSTVNTPNSTTKEKSNSSSTPAVSTPTSKVSTPTVAASSASTTTKSVSTPTTTTSTPKPSSAAKLKSLLTELD